MNRWVRAAAAVSVLELAVAACGSSGGAAPDSSPGDTFPPSALIAAVPVAVRVAPSGDAEIAGKAVAGFGVDLFAAMRATDPSANVTVSPMSVATVLAMLEPGASGAAIDQFHALLHMADPATFHAGMNTLQQNLEARTPDVTTAGDSGDPGEVTMRLANAAYLERGYPFTQAYLQAVGTNYGPVLNEVDFRPDPDAISHVINDFVAAHTADHITNLIADGVIRPDTVLALVNALYLKASWQAQFDAEQTVDQQFTKLDGGKVQVPMMNGRGDTSAQGDGWVGATKHYVGGLSAQFILPDEGKFDTVAGNLAAVFDAYAADHTEGGDLGLPKFTTRFDQELTAPLQALGLTAPFVNEGLIGIANDPKLVIDKVIHQTFVAMDEQGTEAAAATVALMYPTSAPAQQPIPVILDRPFIYRIVDDRTGATLFIGQVLDPTQ